MFGYSQTVNIQTVQWKPEVNEIIYLRGCKIKQPSYITAYPIDNKPT